MALLSAVVLFRMHFVDDDLSRPAVFDDGPGDGRAFDRRRADLLDAVADNGEHLFERDLFFGGTRELFDVDDVALADAVLLSARFDNGVQRDSPLDLRDSLLGRKTVVFACGPFKAALPV